MEPLKIDFFRTPNFSGAIVETQHRSSSLMDLFDSAPVSFYSDPNPHSLIMTSRVTPSATGLHTFEISSVGNARLYINDVLLIDNYNWTTTGETFYSFGSIPKRASLPMLAGEPHTVRLEASTKAIPKGSTTDDDPIHVFGVQPSVRLGFMEEVKSETQLIDDAVLAATEADIVIVIIGLNDEWESEGYDRSSMLLPGAQDELVWRLLEESGKGEEIVIVNQSGSPVHMPWAREAGAVVQTWYGGQEAGNALWDVVMGSVCPSGRLPVTWPMEYKDLGFEEKSDRWPGIEGQVKYEEGTAVGYRWYQREELTPRWWFGYGLSYTVFEFGGLSVAQVKDGWEVSLSVTNVGDVGGREVVQIYSAKRWQPLKELRGFEKTTLLNPGDSEVFRIIIRNRDVAGWDIGSRMWVTEAGAYKLYLGRHAGDPAFWECDITVASRLSWEP